MLDIKKYPGKELDNFSKIFMQIGLVLALFVVHIIMEYKTYEKDITSSLGEVTMVMEMTEDIPIIKMQKIEPNQTVAPPPPSIEDVKVVDDDTDVPETIIESTETDENEAVTDAKVTTDDIVEVAESEEIIEDIPFMLIEDVPIFPGCKGNNSQLKACFTEKVTSFFSNRFDIDLATELGLDEGKKKLYVVFTINKDGKVVNVQSRGPHPELEKEVYKIISSLPIMTPGKQRGIPVGVTYSIPITFDVIR